MFLVFAAAGPASALPYNVAVIYGGNATGNELAAQLRRIYDLDWELAESGGAIISAVRAGLDGDGVVQITEAGDLRGVAVDSYGRIWMAEAAGGRVFRVDNDGANLTSVAVADPYAIAFNGEQALVTGVYDGVISVLNANMSLDETLAPDLADGVFQHDRRPRPVLGAHGLHG